MTKKLIVLTVSIFFLSAAGAQAAMSVASICSIYFDSASECMAARSNALQSNPSQQLSDCGSSTQGWQWCVINTSTVNCTYDTQFDCQSASGVSSCDLNAITKCYTPAKCQTGYYLNSTLTDISGTSRCAVCPANGTCNGLTITCNAGYTLSDTNPDGDRFSLVGEKFCVPTEAEEDDGIGTPITPVADENTVNTCPTGLSKSADGCCCVK